VNHADEANLYRKDYAAWCAYIAPRWAEMLSRADQKRKRELWSLASPKLKEEIRRLAK